jgi:hypothetical protein
VSLKQTTIVQISICNNFQFFYRLSDGKRSESHRPYKRDTRGSEPATCNSFLGRQPLPRRRRRHPPRLSGMPVRVVDTATPSSQPSPGSPTLLASAVSNKYAMRASGPLCTIRSRSYRITTLCCLGVMRFR